MTADQVPTTADPANGGSLANGGESSDSLSVIAKWQAASRQAASTRPNRLSVVRTLFWIAVAIVGVSALAATYRALTTAGKPQVIYNPHVQR